jgi:hypothetical protein
VPSKKPHSETLWIVKRFPQGHGKKPWFALMTLRWDRKSAWSEWTQNGDPGLVEEMRREGAKVVKVLVTEIHAKEPSKKARKPCG